jgi:hypothetical protein
MKTVVSLFVLLALVCGVAAAADITGKWVAERKMKTPDGEERTITSTLDLKADGGKLTGTVTSSMGGGQGRSVEIQEGKIDGNKISFITVQPGRQGGEMKMKWEATVDGNEMKGTQAREGAPEGRSFPFTAKKQ